MLIAVILGNRLNDDGSTTELMEKRLDLALQLIDEKKPEKVIVSGGIANSIAGVSEAFVMKKWLVSKGIDENLIIEEAQSRDTAENAKFSVPIAKNLGASEIVVCTSSEHAHRPYLNPKKLFEKALKKSGIKLSVYSD